MVFQTNRLVKTSTELVKLDKESMKKIQAVKYFKYKIRIPSFVSDKFEDMSQAYYHAEKLFNARYSYSSLAQLNDETVIISPIELTENFLYSFGKNDATNEISFVPAEGKIQLDLTNPAHSEIFSNLFLQSLKRSISEAGYEIRGTTAIDQSTNLLNGIKHYSRNATVKKLQEFVYLFPAFNFRLRKLGPDFFVQLSPRSVLDFGRDLYSLLAEGSFTSNELINVAASVNLPIGRTAKLYAVLEKKACDAIDEKPFNGSSFLDFALRMYPTLKFAYADAKLLLVLPYGNATSPYYFSSELTKPSVRFSDLASWDHDFYALIGSEMKIHSAKRKELIEEYLKKIRFKFFDIELSISDLFSYETNPTTLKPSDFSQNTNLNVFTFANPWLSFRNRSTGRIVDVNRDVTGHLGATVDLLTHEDLSCFNSPPDLKLKIISDESLSHDTCYLMEALINGFGEYKGFEQIFGTRLVYNEIVPVKDLTSATEVYSDVSPENYDCVIVLGPRHFSESSEKSKMIYTLPETEILNRGVPAQYVTDEPSQNKMYDKSIHTKANDPHALFGIGLNILGKVGAKVMVLSPETTNYFLPNSIVIGYNIARIFGPLLKDVSQEESPRDLIRTSTPLAAPIVMMSQDGAEIVLQNVYQLVNETCLFREGRIEKMIDELSSKYGNFIIHKDGPFYADEIADLKKIQRSGRMVIPVSIISNFSPRIFSSLASWNYIPRMGTVVKLSDVDFLMANTLVTQRYDPSSRGWPNTILITIHEEALQARLSSAEKLQILYQIWALTRVHVGSQLPTRKPISIHYSDSMATFLRKVGNPMPEYFNNFGNRRNRHGYIPRIFL